MRIRRMPGGPRRETSDWRAIRELTDMLLIIAILLLLFWGGGLFMHVAGGLIHILLLVALVVFVLHFIRGGRGV